MLLWLNLRFTLMCSRKVLVTTDHDNMKDSVFLFYSKMSSGISQRERQCRLPCLTSCTRSQIAYKTGTPTTYYLALDTEGLRKLILQL